LERGFLFFVGVVYLARNKITLRGRGVLFKFLSFLRIFAYYHKSGAHRADPEGKKPPNSEIYENENAHGGADYRKYTKNYSQRLIHIIYIILFPFKKQANHTSLNRGGSRYIIYIGKESGKKFECFFLKLSKINFVKYFLKILQNLFDLKNSI